MFPGDGLECIEKVQSHCANINFADKSRYDRISQQFTHKGGNYEMTFIERFQNSQALYAPVVNNYSEEQLMHIFLYYFHQGGKYYAQIAIHQAQLRTEGKLTDQKSSSTSSLHTDYLNIDSSSGCGKNSEGANLF